MAVTLPPEQTALTLPAPAKLNLFLHVTGRRPDGYHTLESLFVPIDLADHVTLSLRDDGAVTRSQARPASRKTTISQSWQLAWKREFAVAARG